MPLVKKKLVYNFINNLWRGKPINKLMLAKIRKSGRNFTGKITVRHLGGAAFKPQHRIIDWHGFLIDTPAIILKLEKDYNRNLFLFVLCYANGVLSYRPATRNLKEFNSVISSFSSDFSKKEGTRLPLFLLSSGQLVFNIEGVPFSGSIYSRASGVFSQFLGNVGLFSVLKLSSGVVRLFFSASMCTIGTPFLENFLSKRSKKNKAGTFRLKGFRPAVRGVAMNPIDHPHGGGQGKTSGGRPSVSPWARYTKGLRTRKGKRKWYFLVDRPVKKKKDEI